MPDMTGQILVSDTYWSFWFNILMKTGQYSSQISIVNKNWNANYPEAIYINPEFKLSTQIVITCDHAFNADSGCAWDRISCLVLTGKIGDDSFATCCLSIGIIPERLPVIFNSLIYYDNQTWNSDVGVGYVYDSYDGNKFLVYAPSYQTVYTTQGCAWDTYLIAYVSLSQKQG